MIAPIRRNLLLICCTCLLLSTGCSSQKGVVIKGEQGNVKDAPLVTAQSTFPVPDEVKKKLEAGDKTKVGGSPPGGK